MYRSSYKYALALSAFLPLSAVAATTKPDNGFSFNPTLFTLLSLIVVLVFANAMLAIVLKQLAAAYWDKTREERSGSRIVKTVVLLITLIIPAMHALAQEQDTTIATPDSPYISGILRTDFYFMTGIIAFLMLTMFVLILLIRMLTRALRGVPEKAQVPRVVFRKNFMDLFNKSVAVSEEKDILLDHDYDGIHELDNDLPPWWKYGFILTIITSVLYLGYYHVAGGPSQTEEYNAAVAKAEEEKAEYLAKAANNVDEHTVVMIRDAAALSGAKDIFQATCAACHAKDGGGNVGPNLTDDYWLHGGSIQEVFKSIKYGWPDKGMKSWKDDYSPKQIAALASYVKTLKSTRPAAPKAPQGILYTETDSSVAGKSPAAAGVVTGDATQSK